jgi:hypothetical protein
MNDESNVLEKQTYLVGWKATPFARLDLDSNYKNQLLVLYFLKVAHNCCHTGDLISNRPDQTPLVTIIACFAPSTYLRQHLHPGWFASLTQTKKCNYANTSAVVLVRSTGKWRYQSSGSKFVGTLLLLTRVQLLLFESLIFSTRELAPGHQQIAIVKATMCIPIVFVSLH